MSPSNQPTRRRWNPSRRPETCICPCWRPIRLSNRTLITFSPKNRNNIRFSVNHIFWVQKRAGRGKQIHPGAFFFAVIIGPTGHVGIGHPQSSHTRTVTDDNRQRMWARLKKWNEPNRFSLDLSCLLAVVVCWFCYGQADADGCSSNSSASSC